jgi:hypothetical protein
MSLTITQAIQAIPDAPVPDYVSESLAIAATRHTHDSYRPDNDLRRTQELPAVEEPC